MRLLADECVDGRLVIALQAAGFDIERVTPGKGVPDRAVLALALKRRRLLITEDSDFGELVIKHGLRHPGVLLIRLDHLPPAEVSRRVVGAIQLLGTRLMDRFTVLDSDGVRMRPRPGGDGARE